MSFKVGDRVTWTSQAAGSWLEKIGSVVVVVPRGAVIRDAARIADVAGWEDLGIGRRDHDSYLVRVGTKLYWPRVAALRIDDGSSACSHCGGTGRVPAVAAHDRTVTS